MIADSDWLEYQNTLNGNRNAIISDRSVVTYRQLNEHVNSLAGDFILSGITEKQYIPVLAGHDQHFIIAVYALWRIGAVPVPLSTRLNKREIDDIVAEVNAEYCIIDSSCDYSNSEVELVLITEDKINESGRTSFAGYDADNEALVLFTSGSTGKPKGVVLTFRSLYNSYLGTADFDKYTPDDRILASLPFYHIGGFSTITRACLAGSQLVLPAGTDYISTAEAMSEFDPTIISLVPTNLERMLRNNLAPNKSLRSLYLGGGPSSQRLVGEAVENGFPVIKVYGSTETCSMVSAVRVSDSSEYGTSGRALKGSRISIEDDLNTVLNDQQEGEIVVASGSLFKSYFNDKNLTELSLRKGSYYTGDFGFLDQTGLLSVLLRRTDLIVSGGENINPNEVEEALLRLSGISDCYVTGIQDEEWGQAVAAFVVNNKSVYMNDRQIIDELRKNMSSYKIPKHIVSLEKIPRDNMGKIRRTELLNLINNES